MVRCEQAHPEAPAETPREQVLPPQRDLRRWHVQVHQPPRARGLLQPGEFDVLQEPGAVVVGVGAIVEAVSAQRNVLALALGEEGDRAGLVRDHPVQQGEQGLGALGRRTWRGGDPGDLGEDRGGVGRQASSVHV
jgi:hypothetical protein